MKPVNCNKNINIIIRLIPIAICSLIISGCGGVHYWTATGTDPLQNVDIYLFMASGNHESDNFCNSFEEKFSSVKIEPDHKIQVELDLLLSEVMGGYDSLEKSNFFAFYRKDYNLFCEHGFDYLPDYLCPKAQICVYSLCEPLAVSYPNGKIHISRAIVDADSPFGAKNKAQMIGILSHEYVHIKHGHLLYQWAIADAINEFNKDARRTNWTRILEILPISYSKSIYSTRDLSVVYLLDYQLECFADFYAYMILMQLGYEPEEYIKFLENLKNYLEKKERPNLLKAKQLQLRIQSLQKLLYVNDTVFPEYLILEMKNNNGFSQESSYVGFKFSDYPALKYIAVYWYQALSSMNNTPIVRDFLLYENNVLLPVENVNRSISMYGTQNGSYVPKAKLNGLVLPDKLIEFPLLPSLYGRQDEATSVNK